MMAAARDQMARSFGDRLHGIHAATIVPMTPDFLIDEPALAAHIASVTSVPGINGLLVNGHAGENFVLSLADDPGNAGIATIPELLRRERGHRPLREAGRFVAKAMNARC